jgi:elongation factor 1-beta
MANVVVTLKVMPESPETDLDGIEEQVKEKIMGFAGKVAIKSEREPLAFGLNALNVIFVMDESLGSPDSLVEEIGKIEGVNSVEVSDVRRAIG